MCEGSNVHAKHSEWQELHASSVGLTPADDEENMRQATHCLVETFSSNPSAGQLMLSQFTGATALELMGRLEQHAGFDPSWLDGVDRNDMYVSAV